LKLCFAAHNFKSYIIDGALLRTGSANWSPTGLKRQDNDVHYEVDKALAALFESRFEAMWDRATNRMAATPRSREGCSKHEKAYRSDQATLPSERTPVIP
jgi:phosphatidylserine/phosphatidylglycerophosphate/cardiolipin synthase-like enzyme